MTKILVIEDEAPLLVEMIDWLTLEGYETMSAGDGVLGVEIAFRFQPDLILCDITMPRLDGYGVLLEVHASSLTAFTPFIFLTAKTTYEDIRKGMALGADDYLTKPFKRLDLLHAIETRLKKKVMQDDEHEQQVNVLQQFLASEREQRLLKAKLVAMFSHDFRNPLIGIAVSGQMLRRDAESGDYLRLAEYADFIEASARQLQQMLDDMLLISQMETGGLRLKPEALEPGAFFQQIAKEFQVIHSRTHHILYENNLGETVWADSTLLRHMAMNLISNALKYSPDGHDIRVRLTGDSGHWIFTVQDRGIGIPEADCKHLFEPFHRAGNVGSIPGTGLGLVIVKEVVELHGGMITVASQPGIGTTFTVSIPLNREKEGHDAENTGH
jgi:two-component system, sensor histidine kinase and response regulator